MKKLNNVIYTHETSSTSYDSLFLVALFFSFTFDEKFGKKPLNTEKALSPLLLSTA